MQWADLLASLRRGAAAVLGSQIPWDVWVVAVITGAVFSFVLWRLDRRDARAARDPEAGRASRDGLLIVLFLGVLWGAGFLAGALALPDLRELAGLPRCGGCP